MTQRDFIRLAAIIAGERALLHGPHTTEAQLMLTNVVRSIADHCASVNPRFKRDKFYRAAGFPELADN